MNYAASVLSVKGNPLKFLAASFFEYLTGVLNMKASVDRLRFLFCYDKISGQLSWRSKPGEDAGTKNNKHRRIKVDGENIYIHNIIWFMVTGTQVPKGLEIDHIDRDGCNNIWENLRLVNRCLNNHNQGLRSDNSSGHKGVNWLKLKSKWSARITFNGKTKSLGNFINLEDAVKARRTAELELGLINVK